VSTIIHPTSFGLKFISCANIRQKVHNTMSKVAAVLGVGPGLGSALAIKFAKEGYRVAMMSRTVEKLLPIEKEISNNGGESISLSTDASSEPSVKDAYAKILERFGTAPEVFVYNAGSYSPGSVLDTSLEQFERNLRVNCTGAFIAAKQV
jgi:NAD(P)-dependent dehydrogenase (short-subunit alcohol dehydrogenase family)